MLLEQLPIDPRITVFAGFVFIALSVMFFRLKATKKPTSVKKILIPPLGMSTGFVMFLYPPVHIPISWAALSFIAGAVFLAIPLIKTSHFHIVGEDIYLKPSRAFMYLIVGLLVVRLALHAYLEQYISLYQTAGLFFLLAFGMLLPWRIVMYFQYRKCWQKLHNNSFQT